MSSIINARTKQSLFQQAWDNARKSAQIFGGKPSQYFSECLKQAYKLMKAVLNGEAWTLEQCFYNIDKPESHYKVTMRYTPPSHRKDGKSRAIQSLYFVNADGEEWIDTVFHIDGLRNSNKIAEYLADITSDCKVVGGFKHSTVTIR